MVCLSQHRWAVRLSTRPLTFTTTFRTQCVTIGAKKIIGVFRVPILIVTLTPSFRYERRRIWTPSTGLHRGWNPLSSITSYTTRRASSSTHPGCVFCGAMRGGWAGGWDVCLFWIFYTVPIAKKNLCEGIMQFLTTKRPEHGARLPWGIHPDPIGIGLCGVIHSPPSFIPPPQHLSFHHKGYDTYHDVLADNKVDITVRLELAYPYIGVPKWVATFLEWGRGVVVMWIADVWTHRLLELDGERWFNYTALMPPSACNARIISSHPVPNQKIMECMGLWQWLYWGLYTTETPIPPFVSQISPW